MSLLSINLAVITLADNVASPVIDNTAFSNLSTWSLGSNDTTDSQSSSAFTFRNILLTTNYTVVSPLFSPAITEAKYGQNYKVNVRITITSVSISDVVVQAIPLYLGASGAVFSNTINITPGSGPVDCDFLFDTNGAPFDQIRLDFTNIDGAVYVTTIATVTSIEYLDSIGSFDAGDKIYCKWIPSLDEQQTYLQDNPSGGFTALTFGPDLPDTAIGNIMSIDTGSPTFKSLYSTCSGTTLKEWMGSYDGMSFPYMIESDTPNSAFCSVSGVTCALTFTPPFSITGPTNPYVSDGSVLLTSSGANGSPRYALTDDLYAAMTNTSGNVTGLSPGTYTFYTRDIYNCRDTVEVIVPNTYSYSELYRIEKTGVIDGSSWRVDVLERSYSGAVNEINGGDSAPFKLIKNQGEINNKFDVIRNTSGSLTMLSQRNFQFIGLFCQDDQKYQVKFYKDYGSGLTLEWIGFVSPSLFSEDYIPTPYPTVITCTDNLTTLSEKDFVDDSGNNLMGRLKLIKIIAFILKKTGLSISIYCGINKFAEDHSTGGNNDPLDQTYIDCAAFYEEDGTAWKCDRVIKAILSPFGAYVIQQSGVWWLIDSLTTSTYNYRVFNSDGIVQSNSSFNPVQKITSPGLQIGQIFTNNDAKLNILPAYGTMTVKHSLFTKSVFPKSMDDGWQLNHFGSSASFQYYDIPDSNLKGLLLNNLDVDSDAAFADIPGYNPTQVISPEFQITTLNDSIEIDFEYKATLNVPFDGAADPVDNITYNPEWVEFRWQLILSYSSSIYYYNEFVGWINDVELQNNYFYIDYADQNNSIDNTTEFSKFNRSITLPVFIDTTLVTIQFKLFVAGSVQKHFSSSTILKGIETANKLPIGSRTSGVTSGYYSYTLQEGTDAENPESIYRPNDFNATTNPVVWKLNLDNNMTANNAQIRLMDNIKIQNFVATLMPDYLKPISEELQEYNNDILYKENTEVSLEAGDIPSTIIQHQIYTNIFRYSNGEPTGNWNLSGTIQQVLLNSLVAQYSGPSWNLSGSLLGYIPFRFNSVIQHIVAATTVTLVNQEFANITGWSNFGSGASWAASSGNIKVKVTASGAADTKYLVQTATVNIIAGINLSVASSVERTLTVGRRADEFVIVLFRNGLVVQQKTFSGFTADGTVTDTIEFYTQNDADNIGFYIKNFGGSANPAAYEVDYFRVTGIATTRYYFPDSLSRDERNNLNNASLIQIFP